MGTGAPLCAQSLPDTALAVRLLSQYIAIPSESGKEGPAIDFLERQCRQRGLHVQRLRHDSMPIAPLVASLYPLGAGLPNIIMTHHADVVAAGPVADWQYPPYSGLVAGGEVWGRGALDTKGLGIMHLMALLDLRDAAIGQTLPYNVSLLVLPNEETGGRQGARIVSRYFMPQLNAVAMLGEGGAGLPGALHNYPNRQVFGISIAEKRNLWLQLDLKYRSFGHGAAPPANYVNKSFFRALNHLSDYESGLDFNPTSRRMFKQLGKLEGGMRGFFIRHINWVILRPFVWRMARRDDLFNSLVRNTSVLTNFSNPPGPPNQIASQARAYLDCRLLPQMSTEKFVRQIQNGLFEPRFKVQVLDESPDGPESPPDHPVYKALEEALHWQFKGSAVLPVLTPASSDNNYFRAQGVPVYGLLPVATTLAQLESIHNTNERIGVNQLLQGVKFFKQFLTQMQHQQPAPAAH